mmetsp:Transcript_34441/g.75934  ORF Transcript_34441/g.75934 Transcript_34441/m.75934 type:complete len:204 (+) Transcript_34441:2044-2655(+)
MEEAGRGARACLQGRGVGHGGAHAAGRTAHLGNHRGGNVPPVGGRVRRPHRAAGGAAPGAEQRVDTAALGDRPYQLARLLGRPRGRRDAALHRARPPRPPHPPDPPAHGAHHSSLERGPLRAAGRGRGKRVRAGRVAPALLHDGLLRPAGGLSGGARERGGGGGGETWLGSRLADYVRVAAYIYIYTLTLSQTQTYKHTERVG